MSKEAGANGWLTDDSDDIDLLSISKNLNSSHDAAQNQIADNSESEKKSNIQEPTIRRNVPPEIINLEDDYDDERDISNSLLIHRDSDDSQDNEISELKIDLIESRGNASQDSEKTTNDNSQKQEGEQSGTPPPKRQRTGEGPRSSMPLCVAPKLDTSLTLIQGVDNQLDLSGDVGAVGRAKVKNNQLFLDIKGLLYSTSMNPTNTMCVVSIGDDEAKVTAVTDQVLTIKAEQNLFASNEIVTHGDLADLQDQSQDGGFSMEADDQDQFDGNQNKSEKANHANTGGKSTNKTQQRKSKDSSKKTTRKPPRPKR